MTGILHIGQKSRNSKRSIQNQKCSVSAHSKILVDELSKTAQEDTHSLENERVGAESQRSDLMQRIKHGPRWDSMFAKLVRFKEENGHCLVPNRYAEDPKLGTWVATQRRQFKVLVSGLRGTTSLLPARLRRLQEIGFDFSPKNNCTSTWENWFIEFVKFVAMYGCVPVPENNPLSSWVLEQREEYKLEQKGLPTRLSKERIKLLVDAGFIFEPEEFSLNPRNKDHGLLPSPNRQRMYGLSNIPANAIHPPDSPREVISITDCNFLQGTALKMKRTSLALEVITARNLIQRARLRSNLCYISEIAGGESICREAQDSKILRHQKSGLQLTGLMKSPFTIIYPPISGSINHSIMHLQQRYPNSQWNLTEN